MSPLQARSSTENSIEKNSGRARSTKRKRTRESRRVREEETEGDLRFGDSDGKDISPNRDKAAGSWNVFHTFQDHPSVAIRRPRLEVIASKIVQDKVSARELGVRIKQEARTWSLLAAAGIAPLIYGMRVFKHSVSKGTEIELITAVPKKYAFSLDVYLKGAERPRKEIEEVCGRVIELCFALSDLGYCHLDLKFANIVLDLDPLEVRFIDFDPQYMRDVVGDAHLLSLIERAVRSSSACDVLRLFYVLIMLAWLALAAEKRLAGSKSGEDTNYALVRACLLRAASAVRGPFVIFLTLPGLADSTLMSVATRRMLQYNLEDARRIVAVAPEVIYAQRVFTEASDAFRRTGTATLRVARHKASLRLEQEQRNVLLQPLLNALRRLSFSKLDVEEPLQSGGLLFGATSSKPGGRRRFQSEGYAFHCGSAQGVRTLTFEDTTPPLLPRRLTPGHHYRLEQDAKTAFSAHSSPAF